MKEHEAVYYRQNLIISIVAGIIWLLKDYQDKTLYVLLSGVVTAPNQKSQQDRKY